MVFVANLANGQKETIHADSIRCAQCQIKQKGLEVKSLAFMTPRGMALPCQPKAKS